MIKSPGLERIGSKAVFLAGAMVFASVAIWAVISFIPGSPNVEQTVTFTVTPPSGYIVGAINWNFGDGAVELHPQPSATHQYTSPGTFTVTANYQYQSGINVFNQTDTIAVNVTERRSLVFNPTAPKPGETITFTASNFLSGVIQWNFGDGTIKNNGAAVETHAYAVAGTYLVTARDFNGASCCPISTTVTVTTGPDLRTVTYTPVPAVAGQTTTFTAKNFTSACIKWNFGDGIIVAQGTPVQTHVFQRSGLYTVTAYDQCGSDPAPVSIAVTVVSGIGPGAPFGISFIQIRFEDGKTYKQVSRNFTPLEAFADIKYEGSGIFQAQWLVDGKPVGTLSRSFAFGRETTVNSGQTPPLPTVETGIHQVTLQVIQPKLSFKVPAIRYFVASGELDKRVEIAVSSVRNLGGQIITIEENRVALAPNKDYLFAGTVKNISQAEIQAAILQIYLAGTLLDQIMLKNLKPQQWCSFETSLQNNAATPKSLKLQVFDSAAGGMMLGEKSLGIVGGLLPSPPVMKPDLYIVGFSTDQPFYRKGDNQGTITVVIGNRGGSDITTPFTLQVQGCQDIVDWQPPPDFSFDYSVADLQDICHLAFSETIPGLKKGETLTITKDETFGIMVAGCAAKNPDGVRQMFKAFVDSGQQIAELSEQNNSQAISIVTVASAAYDPAKDQDGDGWMACAPGTTEGCDCNDFDPTVNPCGLDLPNNGKDEDCRLGEASSLIDEISWIPAEVRNAYQQRDLDGDGYPFSSDCDDYNSLIHPGAEEIFGDGRDNNCNNLVDENPGINWRIVEFTAARVDCTVEEILQKQADIMNATIPATPPPPYLDIARIEGRIVVDFDPGGPGVTWQQVNPNFIYADMLRISGVPGGVVKKISVPASITRPEDLGMTFNYSIAYAKFGFVDVSSGNAAPINLTAAVDPNDIFPLESSAADNTRSVAIAPTASPLLIEKDVNFFNWNSSILNDGGFTHGGSHDEWEVGVPGNAPSSNRCWATDLDGYYENNCSQWLRSPDIAVPADVLSAQVYISFWSSFREGDHAVFEVWQGSTKIHEFQIPPDGWGNHTFDLPAGAYGQVIRLRFLVTSNDQLKKEGLYIHSVKVMGRIRQTM